MKLYSYIIPVDDGAAPNPYGGICTLTICKPAIRRTAQPGNWIIGTGSKKVKLADGTTRDYSKHLVHAMRVSEVKPLLEYDKFCQVSLPVKLSNLESEIFEERVGDCLYDFSTSDRPKQRNGVHDQSLIQRDLSGRNAILSDHFYYFGSVPVLIPEELQRLVYTTRGHIITRDQDLISSFVQWLQQFKPNHVYAEPQVAYLYK